MDAIKKSPILSFLAVLIIFVGIFSALVFVLVKVKEKEDGGNFDTFSSCNDMYDYVGKVDTNYLPYATNRDVAVAEEAPASDGDNSASGSLDYSETNIQVEGVDESDVVKTDGRYIYAIKNQKVYVFDAIDPANTFEITNFEIPGDPIEMFLNDEKLIVYATNSSNIYLEDRVAVDYIYPSTGLEVGVFIYDISDKENPELEREVKLDGNFNSARMVDNVVYLVSTHYFYYDTSATYQDPIDQVESYIPDISDSLTTNGEYEQVAACDEISAYGNNKSSFVVVTAINVDSEEMTNKVLMGDASNIYMSLNNLYLATVVYDYGNDDMIPFGEPSPADSRINADVETEIYKLSVDGTDIEFANRGSVPGTILNQFSMDEYYDHFRIATTMNDLSGWNDDSYNNVYVLDEDLNTVGELENLAVGEQIYSVRFIGDRAYMVTYVQVDPLFVIDLSNPKDPSVLGELKIPGFSNYLHPYDANHIIGIGKDTETSGSGGSITTGLKLALFDVTDVENPVVKSEVIIGDRGSDSPVLFDHKAMLFDKEKELLVIPVEISEVSDGNKDDLFVWGTPSFTGFSVFNINLEDGIVERGRIGENVDTDYYFNYDYKARALYIGDYLFTFKAGDLKINKLEDLSEVKTLSLN